MTRDADAQVPDRSRARRLMRGVGGMLMFTVPVVLLGFAVRQQFDPVINLDNSAITAATDLTRRHGIAERGAHDRGPAPHNDGGTAARVLPDMCC